MTVGNAALERNI